MTKATKVIAAQAKATAKVAKVIRELGKLIRIEPTCIRCGCTEYSPCPEGCAWSFLNKKTNEGICSACLVKLVVL